MIQLGNVPVQTGTIAACFDYLAAPNEKVRALEKDGQLIRLKRGLYVVDEQISGKPINVRLCANHIYGPSYVSLQWALRWYVLIPERVFTMTSITTKRSREFENKLGRFTYYQVKPSFFPIGIRSVEENGVNCLMAHIEFTGITVIRLDRNPGAMRLPCLELANDGRHIRGSVYHRLANM